MTANENRNDEDSEEELVFSDDEATFVDGIRIPPPIKPTLSFDPTGPRLIITKIDNNFFKSYAKGQVLGPFHKCFNAIVGPNGSGKSNVIDSLLFVFGYRATKIRSKKVSVLLHNSASYKNVQSCTVAVHFALIIDKAGDEYDVVPGSEFVVSRTANKDNSSFYQLNGRKVQFKEVAVLLKKHGIDLDHNRFLILQGEVEQIAMMKCKAENENESGMLEYLEDIIGTNRYKKPLCQVQDRVDILSERRIEKLNRLKMVEKEVQELTAPMEEAVGFLKVENTVVSNKNFLYQRDIYLLNKKLAKIEEDKTEVFELQKKFLDNLAEIESKKKVKDKELQFEAKRYETLQKRKEELNEAFNTANKKDIQLQENMVQLNQRRKKTKELIVQEQKKLEKLEKTPEQSKEGIAECEKKAEQLTAKKEKLEEEKAKALASIKSETEALQEKKEEMQTDLVILKKAVDETKAALSLAESELKIYTSNEDSAKSKFEDLKTVYENATSTIEERSKQVNALKKKIPATENSLKQATAEFNAVKMQEAKLLDEIRKKRSLLEERRSSMQATRSQGRVLDALMRQKREGACPGLYGRLGDLGAIDQKYDVAISTACGPLDNIVVDTVDTAQWCIEYLKRHDVGRATFIVLEKQEHLRFSANTMIKTPENVPRLFDLVRVNDETVRTAFYYALGNTLVADDIEQASRIAYGAQRYRVVTLGGGLIETSGTMSGGGKSVSKGRMGQSVKVSNVDPRELEQLEETLQEMENNVRELRQKHNSLENQVNALQPELRQMKIDYEKFTMELKQLQEQQPNLKRQLKELEEKANSCKSNPAQVKQMNKVIEEKRKLFDKASEAANALQAEVDKISKEINDKTLGKMKKINMQIKETNQGIDKCKTEITRLKVAAATAARETKKSEEKIKTMQQDVQDMENRLRKMKDERTEVEQDAAKLLECVKEIEEQITSVEKVYSDLKVVVANLTKTENKIKSEKVDVDQKIQVVKKQIDECQGNIHQLEVKVSKLRLQEIPDEPPGELKKYTEEEIENENVDNIQKELERAENHLKVAKPNLRAIEEYCRKKAVYVERAKELDEIVNKRAEMRKLYDKLRTQRKEEFIAGYNIIRMKLKEMYQMITLGGDADFEMVDTFDPFTEGIQFNVRPPKKSWKKICNLSGGEKTLSSLALVFALHYYKPSPLYVMDEIDAALDFKNVSIVANYIKDRTKNAQFIIISLRSNMFELCDNLIGIYKTYNCTKTITIDPRGYDTDKQRHQSQGIEGDSMDTANAIDNELGGTQSNEVTTATTERNPSTAEENQEMVS
nr:unnamed protein product [Callosobruchus analis]